MYNTLLYYFVVATANPFTAVFTTIKNDMKTWIFIVIGVMAVIFSLKDVMKYMQGEEDEKAAAGKAIKYKFYMLIGAYVIVWFIGYLITKFSAVPVA
jgi:hypothetical protein